MNFLVDLQREIYAVNCEKGWHQEPLRNPPIRPGRELAVFGPPVRVHHDLVLAKLALIHSELTEALDEWDAGRRDIWCAKDSLKPEGFVVEIADAIIRTLDTCEALGLGIELRGSGTTPSAVTALLRAHGHVSAMVEAVRVDDFTGAFVDAAAKLLTAFDGVCTAHDLDLWAAVRLKIAYNRTRPHRHGGKRA